VLNARISVRLQEFHGLPVVLLFYNFLHLGVLSLSLELNLFAFGVFPCCFGLCAFQVLLLEESLGLGVKLGVPVEAGLLFSEQELVDVLLLLTLVFDSFYPGGHLLNLESLFVVL
jgi:hypothetical protein